MPLFAKFVERIGKFGFGKVHDQVRGGRPLGAHAHIQLAVTAEREAARRIVDLEAGYPEIEHDAVQRGNPVRRQQLQHIAKIAFDHMQAAGVARGERHAARDG